MTRRGGGTLQSFCRIKGFSGQLSFRALSNTTLSMRRKFLWSCPEPAKLWVCTVSHENIIARGFWSARDFVDLMRTAYRQQYPYFKVQENRNISSLATEQLYRVVLQYDGIDISVSNISWCYFYRSLLPTHTLWVGDVLFQFLHKRLYGKCQHHFCHFTIHWRGTATQESGIIVLYEAIPLLHFYSQLDVGKMFQYSERKFKWKQIFGLTSEKHIETIQDVPPQYWDDHVKIEDRFAHLFPTVQTSEASFPHIPRDMTFTRTDSEDLVLSPSPPAPPINNTKPLPDPPPLFYVTSRVERSSQTMLPEPDLMLHSGPARSMSIIAFAQFHAQSLATDITLCSVQPSHTFTSTCSEFDDPEFIPPLIPHRRQQDSVSTSSTISTVDSNQIRSEKLSPSGMIFKCEKYIFSMIIPRTSVREKFEWRHASGASIRTGDSIHKGMKLVRSITGETVAVYAGLGQSSRTSNPKRMVGMFRLLGERLGNEFDVYAIMSILAIVERSRRISEGNRLDIES